PAVARAMILRAAVVVPAVRPTARGAVVGDTPVPPAAIGGRGAVVLDAAVPDVGVAGVIATPRPNLRGRRQGRQEGGRGQDESLSQHGQSPCEKNRSVCATGRPIHWTRFILTSLVPGTLVPSTVRSWDC